MPGDKSDHTGKVDASGQPDGGTDERDNASVNSAWTESTLVPRRSLGFMQCSSLMINHMIGTGIFTTPGNVLHSVKSKPISLVLWAVGGAYSMIRCFKPT
jgi:hypothetical protein